MEGWHSKLTRCVKKSYPNIFELLIDLEQEQTATELTLYLACLGAAPPERRPEDVRVDNKHVERLRTKFERGDYTVEEYLGCLRRIAYMIIRFAFVSNVDFCKTM